VSTNKQWTFFQTLCTQILSKIAQNATKTELTFVDPRVKLNCIVWLLTMPKII